MSFGDRPPSPFTRDHCSSNHEGRPGTRATEQWHMHCHCYGAWGLRDKAFIEETPVVSPSTNRVPRCSREVREVGVCSGLRPCPSWVPVPPGTRYDLQGGQEGCSREGGPCAQAHPKSNPAFQLSNWGPRLLCHLSWFHRTWETRALGSSASPLRSCGNHGRDAGG